MKIIINKEINGTTLKTALTNAGITFDDFRIDNENELIIGIVKGDENEVAQIVENHIAYPDA